MYLPFSTMMTEQRVRVGEGRNLSGCARGKVGEVGRCRRVTRDWSVWTLVPVGIFAAVINAVVEEAINRRGRICTSPPAQADTRKRIYDQALLTIKVGIGQYPEPERVAAPL